MDEYTVDLLAKFHNSDTNSHILRQQPNTGTRNRLMIRIVLMEFELNKTEVTTGLQRNILERGNICGPCVNGRHNECRGSNCICKDKSHIE